MEKLGITVSLMSGYHPQSNGQVERANQEVSRHLHSYCSQNQTEWSRYLPWEEYAQNSLRKNAINLTPFQCVLGYQPPLFPWNAAVTDSPTVDEWFRKHEHVWEEAHRQLQRAVVEQKRYADRHRSEPPQYEVGDWVWLSTHDIRGLQGC